MKSFKLLFLSAFILLSASLYAQPGDATLSKSGAVILSADQPLNSVYAINAENFNFENSAEAIQYFSTVNTNDVFYRPVLDNNVVMMYLQLKNHPEWTKENWNAYLSQNKAVKKENAHQDAITN